MAQMIEYMCRYCGRTTTRPATTGRPLPGDCPRRKTASGKHLPHSWIINRRK